MSALDDVNKKTEAPVEDKAADPSSTVEDKAGDDDGAAAEVRCTKTKLATERY